jgi:outer membrane immunogenic protein
MGWVYRARLRSSLAGPRLATSIAFLAMGFAATTTAHAADMPVPGAYYPKSFPPPAIYDWTGIYVGFHVGGGILTDSVSQNGAAAFNLGNSGSLRPAGVIGGGQIGANYEFAPWVVGIEGTWTDSAINGNTLIGCPACVVQIPTPPAGTVPESLSQERFTSQALWLAAVTGRFGYAANDWLFYGKAGGAWMHVRYTEDLLSAGLHVTTTVPPIQIAGGTTVATQVISDNRSGFTVGAGIEFGLVENLSGKIEYDFYDFGSKNYNFNTITPVSVRSSLHALTAGLNYKFNWSGGPKP